MPAETLKEYLVKLGWNVDELGYSKALSKVNSFESKINSMGNSISGNFLKAGGFVVSFIATVTGAMAKMIDSTAEADLSVERFARKMWTTEENARSFLAALDAMEASYDDIFYMTPEEYNRFMELKTLGKNLQAPAELNKTLKSIRDITQELNKLKVIFNYATQWITYYLGKYLGKDIDKIKLDLKSMNDWIIKNLPNITDKIARFFVIVYKLGRAGYVAIKGMFDIIVKLFNLLPASILKTGAVITGFLALFRLGPIGMFIAAILTVLALIDDIYTWKKGGKSAYGDFYGEISSMFKDIDYSGLKELTDILGDFYQKMLKIKQNKLLDDFRTGLDMIKTILQSIADALSLITGNTEKMSNNSVVKKILGIKDKKTLSEADTAVENYGKKIDTFNVLLSKIFGTSYIPIYTYISDFLSLFTDNKSKTASSSAASVYTNKGGGGVGNTINQTQNNNINITPGPSDSANSTAKETANQIIRQRSWYDNFNR